MIDKKAVVDSKAKIAKDVSIGPFSVIGPEVEIGSGTWIGPNVVIKGPTKIGKNNKIFQFASVGEDCQDKKYAGERTFLEIGDDNVIREGVTIHRGTAQDEALTKIGNDNLFMGYVHIAHDCVIGNHNIFANASLVAGHVTIGDYVILSGFCGIHQFCQIGSHAFVSHASLIGKDIPPYLMITGGAKPTACGLNVEGLKRRGFSAGSIQWLRRAYKIIYRQGFLAAEAIEKLKELESTCAAIIPMREFLQNSKRGIIR